jgi:hypothetical protein
MAILNNSNAISSGGYDVNNSLRFRSSANASLSRTPASSGNRKTFTWSGWVKRGALTVVQRIFEAGTVGGAESGIQFYGASNLDSIEIYYYSGSYQWQLTTTQLFRDPSAWYHIVVAIDTTQATAANRIKLYINGQQVTAFATASYPTQNSDTIFNTSGTANYIGTVGSDTSNFFDGYMADINFIDGSQKAASDFGETDTTTGVWKPKAYTSTYGTNGFYLKFSDIATTSGSNAGLGKDFSGNGNYYNTNNISVTAGTTYDAMIDSPTLTSATVANYCVMNPLKINGSAGTFSNANLNVIVAGDSSNSGTMAFSSGKIYFEVQLTAATESTAMIGIADSNFAQAVFTNGGAINYGYVGTGVKGSNGSYVSYGASYTVNDIIGVAADLDAGTLVFYKNGVSQGTAYTSISGTFIPVVGNGNSGTTKTYVANFGQRPFAYTPPTGFVRLNTFNLPDSTIKKGNSYMNAVTYTGSASNVTVTSGFYPDLTWAKSRNNTYNNSLIDSNRGGNVVLFSNSTSAESTVSGLATFSSTGVTYLAGASGVNADASTNYVLWAWNAGAGSTSSNTSGNVTSTVSANTTAGFSIVTYTVTSTVGMTIGHGLGVAPKMIIEKTSSSSANWDVYHASLGNTGRLLLNSTSAFDVQSGVWNNTSPTSTVFSQQGNGNWHPVGTTCVAYCWAEIAGFSKFGSYTGNGSADGPFVYTGFRPKFIMRKQTSNNGDVGGWIMFDASRDDYNVATKRLLANSSNAEATPGNNIDILSNGWKERNSDGYSNASGQTYIYMAFAENPFKNANAR